MENRSKHMGGVASYMFNNAKTYNLDPEEMYVLGVLHDVGYLRGVKEDHEVTGARILKEKIGVTNPHILWCVHNHDKIIKHFSWSIDRHRKAFLLMKADMIIDSNGEKVGYKNRLKDIGERYGFESETYQKCEELINWLKKIEKIRR